MIKYKKLFAFILAFIISFETIDGFSLMASEIITNNIIIENINEIDLDDIEEPNVTEEIEEDEIKENDGALNEEDTDVNVENKEQIEEPKEPLEENNIKEKSNVNSESLIDNKEYETNIDEINKISSLVSSDDYYSLSKDEKEVLLLEAALREDTMATLSDSGYSLSESIVKAWIMQQLDISLNDTLNMINNFGDENIANKEAIEFRRYQFESNLIDNDDLDILISKLISGISAEKVVKSYLISKIINKEVEEIILQDEENTVESLDYGKVIPIENIAVPPTDNEILENIPETPAPDTGEVSENEIENNTEQNEEKETEAVAEPKESNEVIAPPEVEANETSFSENNNEDTAKSVIDKGAVTLESVQLNTLISEAEQPKVVDEAIEVDSGVTAVENPNENVLEEDINQKEDEEPKEDTANEEAKKEEGKEENEEENNKIEENEKIKEEIIKPKEEVKRTLSKEDLEKIIELANEYNIEAEFLIEFIIENNLGIIELESIISSSERFYNLFKPEEAISTFSTKASNSEIDRELPSAPFSFSNNYTELINKNTGALTVVDGIVNLSGKSGLDLNLELIYDSSKATIDHASGTYADVYLFAGGEFTDNRFFYLIIIYRH